MTIRKCGDWGVGKGDRKKRKRKKERGRHAAHNI
jgi:hypothetical protein